MLNHSLNHFHSQVKNRVQVKTLLFNVLCGMSIPVQLLQPNVLNCINSSILLQQMSFLLSGITVPFFRHQIEECLLNTNFTHSYERAPPKHYTPLLFASILFFFVTFLNFCTNLSIQNFHQFVHNTFSFLGNQTVLQREVIDYNTSMSKQNGQDCDMLPGMSKVFNAIEFPTKITRVNPGMLIIPPS